MIPGGTPTYEVTSTHLASRSLRLPDLGVVGTNLEFGIELSDLLGIVGQAAQSKFGHLNQSLLHLQPQAEYHAAPVVFEVHQIRFVSLIEANVD